MSSYRDIGRDSWHVKPRPKTAYARHFEMLRQAMRAAEHELVLYIEPALVHSMALNTTGVTVVPLSSVRNGIYSQYLERQRSIMASATYRAHAMKRIPAKQLKKPEHSIPEYTMVNHDKIALLDDARQRFAGYTHVIWIDFGAIRDQTYAPRKLDLCRLPANRILASNADPIIDPLKALSPWEMLGQPMTWSNATQTYASRSPKDPICGTIIIFPTSIIADYRRMYEAELRAWQQIGFAHCDQVMMFQLYKKSNGSLFDLWSPPASVQGGLLRCRAIFQGLLNLRAPA